MKIDQVISVCSKEIANLERVIQEEEKRANRRRDLLKILQEKLTRAQEDKAAGQEDFVPNAARRRLERTTTSFVRQ